MKVFYCDEIEKNILNLVYKGKQFHGKTLFLTLKEVFRITGKGKVDFGGSEFVEADREIIEPVKKIPEDQYGWWDLDPGTYHVKFNESFEFEKEMLYIITPSKRILSNGAYHPTSVTIESKYSPSALLIVGGNGIAIKENARISLCKILSI